MSAEVRRLSKSRSNERERKKRGKREGGGPEKMQLNDGSSSVQDGQGLGWKEDVSLEASAPPPPAAAASAGDTFLEVSDEDSSDPELLPDLDSKEELQGAPAYFLAGLRIQANQTREVVRHAVKKSVTKTNKQLKSLASGVKANQEALHANQTVMTELAAANANLEKQVGDLNGALDVVKQKLDQLEKAEKSGDSSTSTAHSISSSAGGPAFPASAPLGANRFEGYQRQSADSSDIDRSRFYGGSHPDMPKNAVVNQLEQAVRDYNNHERFGQSTGHLVVEALFVPMTVSNWWIKFRSSLGKSSIDQGHAFKRFVYDQKLCPVGADAGTQMRLQPNRTVEERSVRGVVNAMLSFEHRQREKLGLGPTWIKKGIAGAIIVRAKFGSGHEAAFWKDVKLGCLETPTDAALQFVSDEAIRLAWEEDYQKAKIPFSVEEIRKEYQMHLAERENRRQR